jgi:hypothetical protein
MTKFVSIALAAALMQPALSVAADGSTDSHPKPSSFVPHPHTQSHVYGSPLQPAIVGHSKASHHKNPPKKQASSPKTRTN